MLREAVLSLFLAWLAPGVQSLDRAHGRVVAAPAAMAHVVAQPVQFSMSAAQSAAQVTDPAGSLAASEAKAKSAVAAAEAAVKEVQRISKENTAYIPLVQGLEAEAKTSLETAKEAAKEAQELVAKTKVATDAAAMEAAKNYMQVVKKAAHEARQSAAAARAKAESDAETKAAMAAASAIEPYHLTMMRGQKVLVEYQTRAQELAAASNNLKAQAVLLSNSAEHYQFMNFPIQANQIMMQAHELFNYADMMKKEATRLHGISVEISGAMPAYAMAAQLAAEGAQEGANGVDLPAVQAPYFIQREARRMLRRKGD